MQRPIKAYAALLTYHSLSHPAISPLYPGQQPTTSPVANGMVVGWYIGYTSAIHRVTRRGAKQHQENATSTFNLCVLVSLKSH